MVMERRTELKEIWAHNRLQSEWLEILEIFCGSERLGLYIMKIPVGIEVESFVTPLSV